MTEEEIEKSKKYLIFIEIAAKNYLRLIRGLEYDEKTIEPKIIDTAIKNLKKYIKELESVV